MPAFTSALLAPDACISTHVPSSGLARRILPQSIAIGRQYPFDAFGDVGGRQRRAGNVANVAVDLERAAAGFANELRQPARASDLAAIGFPVLQDLDAVHGPCGRQRDGIIDQEMLADDAV